MTDKEIVKKAKEAEKRTGFGELVHSPISKGVNSAFGIGFIEGMVEYRNSLQEESTTSVWHDANTLPSDPKAIIVEHNEYSTSICRAEQMSRVKGAKWAYIEDLLKL